MKTLFTILVAILFCNIVFAQWYTLNSPTGSSLKAVHFVSATTGWIGGSNGTLMKTINGGASWVSQTVSTAGSVYDIHFTSSQTGIVCCGDGKIFKTVNGGADWVEKFGGGSFGLFGMQFRDNNHGYAVGGPTFGSPVIKVTADGGETWYSMDITQNQLRTVHFFSSGKGLVAGADGKIMKTTNGGVDWHRVYTCPTGTVMKLFYASSSIGYAVGSEGAFLKTTEQDTNWTATHISGIPAYHSANSLYFINSTEGWVVCEGGFIAHTSSGGNNFQLQNSGTTNDLNDVFFYNSSHGFAVGDGGVILSTNPVSGIENQTQTVNDFSLAQNYPNPFNNSTVIKYSIPQEGLVSLKVYNLLGEEVVRLVNDTKQTGHYEVSFDATGLPSGVYFYQLKTGSFVQTNKMLLVK